ncbi:MAG: polysaccharide biosynthesis protein [Alphaproteobacteria bacterium]|nr:polysaccharide biosynthesis protein [Alphaproteobacteria bacterium]MCB9693394.1 polysaccharide biosynthesis protein [Alphaproteobacteria bacterium]
MSGASESLLRYRRPLVVIAHLAIWTAAYLGAFALRFDGEVPERYWSVQYIGWLAPLLLLRTIGYAHFGLFRGMWKYTGQRDLIDIAKATTITSAVFALIVMFSGMRAFPRSILLTEFMLTIAMVGGIRFANRTLAQATRHVHATSPRRMLIVGAGDAGEALLREVQRSMGGRVETIGFLDDNPAKTGMLIHGVKVLGTTSDAPAIIEREDVTEVALAMPSATGADMRRILDAIGSGVNIRTIPGLDHLVEGQVTINQLREVAIEDLLGRDPVQLDMQRLSGMIRNEVVLVTGAGGSIGSELCRQVLRFQPRTLVLLEQAENALYQIHRELAGLGSNAELVPRIADITDHERLDRIFAEHQPGIVIHAAAHKHVPMMEWNPTEAVKNNVGGSRAVADAAHRHRAHRFVMVSTDKAVNPTSVMGCTKRIAELYVQAMAQVSQTRFTTVRFGNVLGSNGSVIPLFREQIARGGPVTVTHPDMERYFMTIPEASQLVLQAASMANSGEVYVLDMGEPVKIVTLAEDLIRLSGLTVGRDIQIEFVGTRPGEKLFEELSTDSEHATRTPHEKIFVSADVARQNDAISRAIDRLLTDLDGLSAPEVRKRLRQVVPEFKSPEDAANDEGGQVIALR